MNNIKFSLIIVSIFMFTGFIFTGNSFSESVRTPKWSGQFYPSDKVELSKTIEQLTIAAQKNNIKGLPQDKPLKAIIMPHAGYIYSGLTAAHISHLLHPKQFAKVILMGPDHRVGFTNAVISYATKWETPLGQVVIHPDIEKLKKLASIFQQIPASENQEHSLEVQIPFLQYYLKEFQLIPITLGKCDIAKIANYIDPLADETTLLVASSDLSHYLDYDRAMEKDNETIAMIMNLDSDKLINSENAACGIMPILVVIEFAKKYNWQPILMHRSDSGNTAGNRDRVVGYVTIAFFGGNNMSTGSNKLSQEVGDALVKLAREAIGTKLGLLKSISDNASLSDPSLQKQSGTFVTLTAGGNLRGCIGSIIGQETILDGVKRNSLNAAFNDPRFPPLKKEEFDRIHVEVSILTEPKPLTYKDVPDLLSKIHPGVDGLIIKKGYASATFLPQVWDQLPDHESFLSHLCQKAGLSSKEWKNGSLEVMTYQVQYFEESHSKKQ